MADRLVMAFLTLGFFVVAIGLFVPPLIDAQELESQGATELDEGQSETFDELVTVTLDAANVNPDNINVTVTDEETLSDEVLTNISVGETKTATPRNGDEIDVTLDEVLDGNTAQFTVSFATTYGWDPAAIVFINNFDVMITLVGVLVILGTILVAVR